MSNINVFIGTENSAKIILRENGSKVPEGVVNKVSIWMPGVMFSDGAPKTVDNETDPEIMELVDESQAINVRFGLLPSLKAKARSVQCFLTVYDPEHPNGIAWAKVQLTLNEWNV